MKFYNLTENMNIDKAIEKAEKLLKPGSMLIQSVKNKNDWQYNSGTGMRVASELLSDQMTLTIDWYKPKYKNSKAIGYYDGVNAIYFNIYKSLSKNELVGFLLHEYAHHCGFHHKSWIWFLNNRKTAHKCQYSVPYYLSENVERWL